MIFREVNYGLTLIVLKTLCVTLILSEGIRKICERIKLGHKSTDSKFSFFMNWAQMKETSTNHCFSVH